MRTTGFEVLKTIRIALEVFDILNLAFRDNKQFDMRAVVNETTQQGDKKYSKTQVLKKISISFLKYLIAKS